MWAVSLIPLGTPKAPTPFPSSIAADRQRPIRTPTHSYKFLHKTGAGDINGLHRPDRVPAVRDRPFGRSSQQRELFVADTLREIEAEISRLRRYARALT